MYRHCIFCSHTLGANESLEEFPVGSRLAFDAWKGRLWAVCPRCGRWNLAPIEERWEAVEAAEKRFRDSRLRVHSENIGLARLADGTRLIRVGEALPDEFAAWRYGDELMRRRRRAAFWGGAATVIGVGAAGAGVVASAGLLAMYLPLFSVLGNQLFDSLGLARHQRRVLARVAAEEPGAPARLIRVQDLFAARLTTAGGARLALEIPDLGPQRRLEEGGVVRWAAPPPTVLQGESAERVLSRTLVVTNRRGATPQQLGEALRRLGPEQERERFLHRVAERGGGLFSATEVPNPLRRTDLAGGWRRFVGTFRGERIGGGVPIASRPIPREELIALEMALHEDTERRALEGELRELERAWREAEEIAGIADAIPEDPLGALRPTPP